MKYSQALTLKLPGPAILLALWAATGLLLGSAFALTGVVGLIAAALPAVVTVFVAFAAKFPSAALCATIWSIALVPASWGIPIGGLSFEPLGDEVLLLLYLAAFPILYIITARTWQRGFAGIYLCLTIFLGSQVLSFAASNSFLGFRIFLETYVAGALLLVLFLQEGHQAKPATIGSSIAWLTICIAALSVVERIVQRNPFIDYSTLYLSADIVREAGGVYRPYVSFIHPSEAGTFIAMGVPFVVLEWLRRRSWISAFGVALVAAGLFVNATRGVWFAVLVCALVALLTLRKRAWIWLVTTTPVLAIATWIISFTFKTSALVRRVTNPHDFLVRLEYWKVSLKMISAHPITGVGPFNADTEYLNYVRNLGSFAEFDISKLFVVDNLFLSTAVYQGLLGLAGLLGILISMLIMLRASRKKLVRLGASANTSLVRCCELALVVYCAAGCLADVQGFTKATKFLFIIVGLGLAERAVFIRTASGAFYAKSGSAN